MPKVGPPRHGKHVQQRSRTAPTVWNDVQRAAHNKYQEVRKRVDANLREKEQLANEEGAAMILLYEAGLTRVQIAAIAHRSLSTVDSLIVRAETAQALKEAS